MFVYENIPDEKTRDALKGVDFKNFPNIPEKIADVCMAVEFDPDFFWKYSKYYYGTKTVRNFTSALFSYLEEHGAVVYSINDSLKAACIRRPLAITYEGYKPDEDNVWKVKDISRLYDLTSGTLRLPRHHQANITYRGTVPTRVKETLRDYIEYVLKCEDKDFGDLLKELVTLTKYDIIDDSFFAELLDRKTGAKTNEPLALVK